jgi:methylenetetrahydrofolate dehydrogenase (NADP+)/methenyltetrahydrofolate cyclohydrolase
MSPKFMDGKAFAKQLRSEIEKQVKEFSIPVGLGTILVGDDPGSIAYVEGKHRDCAEVGIKSIRINLPVTASTDEVIAAVSKLNTDPLCTGFIVQLPLPNSIDVQKVLAAINPKKDADGLTSSNLGNLVLGFNTITPCTPLAIVALLEEYKVSLAGQKVLIIGRGRTVGRPLSILLSQKPYNATVILAHSVTTNLAQLLQDADIVISAIGIAHFIKPEMIKKDAIVVDVGISRLNNQLVGDVDPRVIDVASLFAPMPGGIGPMTRVMLLRNLIKLAQDEK